MTVIAFDTLKFVETLRGAGVPDRHARAISQAVREAHETAEPATGRDLRETVSALRGDTQTLGTGIASDMQALRSELKSDVQELRSELKSDVQELRAEVRAIEPRLTIRLGGVVVVALGAFTALSKRIA